VFLARELWGLVIYVNNRIYGAGCHVVCGFSKSECILLFVEKVCRFYYFVKNEGECLECYICRILRKFIPAGWEVYFSLGLCFKTQTDCVDCHKKLDTVALVLKDNGVLSLME